MGSTIFVAVDEIEDANATNTDAHVLTPEQMLARMRSFVAQIDPIGNIVAAHGSTQPSRSR